VPSLSIAEICSAGSFDTPIGTTGLDYIQPSIDQMDGSFAHQGLPILFGIDVFWLGKHMQNLKLLENTVATGDSCRLSSFPIQ